jgi:hypothetical protein
MSDRLTKTKIMEIGRRNTLSEHEIEQVLLAHPEDGWDLLQQNRIRPVTLEVLTETEESRDLSPVIQLGDIANKGADIHRPLAA